ncbi:MAG: hypothetical protein H0U44_00695 [Flavisolibacter sp.]|jgi:hypothetical protein|nr:hypothetical protein [Flavisolibacter sp.]
MPRQNFLSRESFVNAGEIKTRNSILSLPFHLDHIELYAENRMIDSLRFYYVHPSKRREYFVDITVLPLNEEFTRVSLHAVHVNGQSFYDDAEMAIALHDFESAIHASVNGELAQYKASGLLKIKEKKSFIQSSFLKFLFPSIQSSS